MLMWGCTSYCVLQRPSSVLELFFYQVIFKNTKMAITKVEQPLWIPCHMYICNIHDHFVSWSGFYQDFTAAPKPNLTPQIVLWGPPKTFWNVYSCLHELQFIRTHAHTHRLSCTFSDLSAHSGEGMTDEAVLPHIVILFILLELGARHRRYLDKTFDRNITFTLLEHSQFSRMAMCLL